MADSHFQDRAKPNRAIQSTPALSKSSQTFRIRRKLQTIPLKQIPTVSKA